MTAPQCEELWRVEVPLRAASDEELVAISQTRKLALSLEDMRAVQGHYLRMEREPTDVELEVWAQTWSEHCKHRILNARIEHERDGASETLTSLFHTYIRQPSEAIMRERPDFVLSAFHDNAGFIKLDDELAVGLKVETHNHPSAIEPYAGANTGLGGVIRDILGAGKGAKPIASLDVFCVGEADTPTSALPEQGVIHPLGILRGIVRGVRDYGNRMGIPTVAGAILFDQGYVFNPLVFCGTAGVIPIADIPKEAQAGDRVLVLGGRTGRDGLRGATFSSASLDAQSREEDQGAVQIGNPIEEKKAADCLLQARQEGLIHFVTDCGAGGLSSAVGEMAETCGAVIELERVPLKASDLTPWEIFLSESQERMVLAVPPEHVPRVMELATAFESECTDIGVMSGDGHLRVRYHDEVICDLQGSLLHDAPRRNLRGVARATSSAQRIRPDGDPAAALKGVLGSLNGCSREPIIREYDFEVQGNTLGKPLAGPGADGPADAAVLRVEGSAHGIAMGLSVLPAYRSDPYRMGQATVDEAIRQMVVTGADPDRIALLDNICMGDPDNPAVVGDLVEMIKGMSAAAVECGAPFISGKDSFYNCYDTATGTESIPPTLLVSGLGIVARETDITPALIRRTDSVVAVLGETVAELGGSAYATWTKQAGGAVPAWDGARAMCQYRLLYQAICAGDVLAAHDISEGGLLVALAEMGFSLRAGLDVDVDALPVGRDVQLLERLFAESTSRILLEIPAEREAAACAHFGEVPFAILGRTTDAHRDLIVRSGANTVLQESLNELKVIWKQGLTPYY